MNNIYVLNKSYRQIGVLSNQGANPQAPYYDDLYVQELDTGADTYQFSAVSNKYTQDLLEIGNHIMFSYKNRNELFTITSLEYSHYEGYKTIGVYAEGIGFELLDIFMERPPIKSYPSNDNNNGSSSGGNSGGNDSDGDGDDNTDDEYADPDDVYIDENGNIIYDKNGSGPPKKEDVTIDGDGNIIYKANKRNEKNDSLEFKNISYSTFLNILLKNTGWSYVCQPGLESVKHNISVKYDTNIYAILQDSMQAYRGVELEFVYEMHGGKVQKTIKAYKDGGRGSFVGKRFEYGTNVRGITKTQEVTNSEDDTVLYVDNIGVEVYYDVDFALKSAEVSEIEIGDTHYVIDREFCPPMTIKARIGKIEISFSDPTKNKISLANNKKIRGSAIEDELDEDSIKDIIDDYDSIIDDGIVDDGSGDDGTGDDGSDTYVPGIDVEELSAIELHSALLTVPLEENKVGGSGLVDDQNTSLYPALGFGKKQVLEFLMNDIEVCRHKHEDVAGKYWRAGIKDFPAYLDIIPNVEFSNNPLYFHRDHNSEGYDRWSDCEWRSDVASAIVIKDTEDINGDGDEIDEGEHTTHSYNLPSLVAAVIAAFQYHIDYHPGGGTGGDSGDSGDSENNGDSGSGYDKDPVFETLSVLFLTKTEDLEVTNQAKIKALEAGDVIAGAYMGKYMQLSEWIQTTELVVNDIIETKRIEVSDKWSEESLYIPEIVVSKGYDDNITASTKITPDGITFSDGTTLTSANGLGGENGESPDLSDYATIQYLSNNYTNTVDLQTYYATKTYISNNYTNTKNLQTYYATKEYVYNAIANLDNGDDNTNSSTLDTLTVRKIKGPEPEQEGFYNEVEFEDGIRVTHIFGNKDTDSLEIGANVSTHYSVNIYNDLFVEEDLTIAGNFSIQQGLYADKIGMRSDPPSGYSYDMKPSIEFTYEPISNGGMLSSYRSKIKFYAGNSTFLGDLWVPTSSGKIYGALGTSSDKSLKENIRYIDEPVKRTNDDLLDKADLHDFIVNQIDLCEYNYIGDTSDNIGFIANDYEGTKVGDKIVSRNGENDTLTYNVNNLLFATIGALQEEVRIRDEQIASLEARLAAIEEMLNNK